jgi:hypothetical protein
MCDKKRFEDEVISYKEKAKDKREEGKKKRRKKNIRKEE